MPKKQEVTIEQYREKLSKVCERAIASTEKWIEKNPDASRQDILDTTYKITQTYGLAASTLAANKYDQDAALAERLGFLKPGQVKEAEVIELADYNYREFARAINGTIKNSSKERIPDTVGRMVKQMAEDTTLKNANRDGAEYAWIPAGDSCVFCLSLAANGWQRASKKTAEGNHADHIHPHCDCTFAVRFSKDTNVKGYHPEAIKARIEACEGDTWEEKLNSLRREINLEKKYRNDIIQLIKKYADDKKIREWYVENVSNIPKLIDRSKPIYEQARQAYELRNKYKHEARLAMMDKEMVELLEKNRPVLSFEELIDRKMMNKHLSYEEAVRDILETASKTNSDVNKEFGL